MTYREGFVIGFGFGLFLFLLANGTAAALGNGTFSFDVLTATPTGPLVILAEVMVLGSIIFLVGSAIRQRSFIDTTVDGIVYGFTLGFDILIIVGYLLVGQLPPP